MKCERFEFAFQIEAVAALGLEGRCSVFGEASEIGQGSCLKALDGSGAQSSNTGKNAAAGFGDLLVGGASDAALVLIGARLGEDKMRVRIDESGKNDSAAEVEGFGVPSERLAFHSFSRADGGDAAAFDDQCAIADHSHLSEGAASARRRARESKKLRAAGDESRVGQARILEHRACLEAWGGSYGLNSSGSRPMMRAKSRGEI